MPTTYAIPNGRTVFDATLYTGTGATQSIANQYGFKPDMVWVKARSAAQYGRIADSVRGAGNLIYPALNYAEINDPASITSFNSGGFSLGSDGNVNGNGTTYVGWQWQAGQGTTSSNTNGSITSTVSVNQTAGFSVVTYTGTGAVATVGHGLGVAPSMMIVKLRSGAANWKVYHASLGNTVDLELNTTSAAITDTNVWNNTSPTSSVFTVGSSGELNPNGGTAVAYCWAQIAGFSQFGKYTGNGSSDGPFIYMGFRPKFVMIKQSNTTEYWYMWDSTRNTYNVLGNDLIANLSNAEGTNTIMDFTSNGFKIRTSQGAVNTNGGTYVYMAFAENPFKYANAR